MFTIQMVGKNSVESIKKIWGQYQTRFDEVISDALPPAVLAPAFSLIPLAVVTIAPLLAESQSANANKAWLKGLALAAFGVAHLLSYLSQVQSLDRHGYNASVAATAIKKMNASSGLAALGSLLMGAPGDIAYLGGGSLLDLIKSQDTNLWSAILIKNVTMGLLSAGLNYFVYYNGDRLTRQLISFKKKIRL